jgi:hypothetical protein
MVSPVSPGSTTKATPAPIYITKIDVPKYTDLEDDQGFRFTVYNIRVTQSDGKVWTIGRRYNEVPKTHKLPTMSIYASPFCLLIVR